MAGATGGVAVGVPVGAVGDSDVVAGEVVAEVADEVDAAESPAAGAAAVAGLAEVKRISASLASSSRPCFFKIPR